MIKNKLAMMATVATMAFSQSAQADDYLLPLCDSPTVTAVDYDIDTGLTLTIAMNGAEKPDKVGEISSGDVLSVEDFATKWGLSDGDTFTLTDNFEYFSDTIIYALDKAETDMDVPLNGPVVSLHFDNHNRQYGFIYENNESLSVSSFLRAYASKYSLDDSYSMEDSEDILYLVKAIENLKDMIGSELSFRTFYDDEVTIELSPETCRLT